MVSPAAEKRAGSAILESPVKQRRKVETKELQATKTPTPANLRFRKASGVEIVVGAETLFMPRGVLEFIPKLRDDLAKSGSETTLHVNIGRCGLDIFEELLSYGMCRYLGQTDEEAVSRCVSDRSKAGADAQLARRNFNRVLDLLVLGLQCGMDGVFKDLLLKAARSTVPLDARDFKKVVAVCKLLPSCRDLQERPSEVLGEVGQHWESSWAELFQIFSECWRLGVKDVVLAASRRPVTCLKAPAVLLAFARSHKDLGPTEMRCLAEHIGQMFVADPLPFKLLKEEDQAFYFQIAEDMELRRKILDIQHAEGPFIKLPSMPIFKMLKKVEVEMFCKRLVRFLEKNPNETHVVTVELLNAISAELREDILLSLRDCVVQGAWAGKLHESLPDGLATKERSQLIRCLAQHLLNVAKSSGTLNESEKQGLLHRYATEFSEAEVRSILESIEKQHLLPEKSKRKGASRGVLVNLVMSRPDFWVGSRIPMLVDLAIPHLDHGIRKDEYIFLWAGLQDAPALAQPILERLLRERRFPLTKAVEEALHKDLAILAASDNDRRLVEEEES